MQHRIVSLIASATEIVAALGCGEQLVGRSHECDFPPSIERLPACSESKVNIHDSSRAIDDRVKSLVREGLSVYRVDSSLLDRLQPTLIVTQTQCDVCAVSLKDVEEAVCQLVSSQPEIVSLEPMSLSDVWNDIRRVATALNVSSRGEELVADLQRRLADIATQTAPRSDKPRIACIEWIDPLMFAGNWVPELVAIAGGVNLFGTAGEHSGYFGWDDLHAADPDVLVILPCGFDIPRCREEMSALTGQPEWRSLSAVQNGRVYLTDGNQFFNRPGPRLVESAEILAEILHPGLFAFGHRGCGWIPMG